MTMSDDGREDRLRVQRPGSERRLVTAIGVCLDESGSMGATDADGADKKNAAIRAFNEYLEGQQRETADECLLTLVKFNTVATVVYERLGVALAPRLTPLTYTPNGGTALFDAMAHCIASVGVSRADRYAVVVITDGENNASRETTLEQLRALIDAKVAEGNWTFVYLSAGPAAFERGAQYGFAPGNMAAYGPSARGTAQGVAVLSASMRSYRGSNLRATSQFYAGSSDGARQALLSDSAVPNVDPLDGEDDDSGGGTGGVI